VASSVPPGSGLGTSASVVVALIAALQALAGDVADPATLARAAHEIETVDLGFQSGVQDQIAAAYGGSNLITVDRYPEVNVRALDPAPATWDALARRIVTVYLGAAHRSSAVHETVIAHLTAANEEPLLAPLRAAAKRAAAALVAGNLGGYGQAMIANTDAQAALHPSLVNPVARQVIEVAERHGAAGWKVNGAGGDGGTVTIVGPDDAGELGHVLTSIAGLTVVPLRPAREGARIVDQA
jgi:D-glycero-alpha-D-manno-heptose-7-phosphate kinase